tara:strand:- start:1980 stop:2300 length:321 start_codon:yes stop_codon:yes gene_type:complete
MNDYDYCIEKFLDGKSVNVKNLKNGVKSATNLVDGFNSQSKFKVKLIQVQDNFYLVCKYYPPTQILGNGKIEDGFITIAKDSLLKEKLTRDNLIFGRNEGCGIGEG